MKAGLARWAVLLQLLATRGAFLHRTADVLAVMGTASLDLHGRVLLCDSLRQEAEGVAALARAASEAVAPSD